MGSIDLPLLKEKVGNNEKMIVDYDKGLKSITKYKVLEYSNGFSLVKRWDKDTLLFSESKSIILTLKL